MPKGKPDLETSQKTVKGAWFYLVISTVISVSMASLTVLGATAFLAWKDSNWDGIAILALSAAAVTTIPVGTLLVLRRLSDSGEEREEEGPGEEGTQSV